MKLFIRLSITILSICLTVTVLPHPSYAQSISNYSQRSTLATRTRASEIINQLLSEERYFLSKENITQFDELCATLKTNHDYTLLEKSLPLIIQFSFSNNSEVAAIGRETILHYLTNVKPTSQSYTLQQKIVEELSHKKISTWKDIVFLLRITALVSPSKTNPLIANVISNITLNKIRGKHSHGETIGDIIEEMHTHLATLLDNVGSKQDYMWIRMLLKTLPRDQKNDKANLHEAWQIAEYLDDSLLDSKLSHELRERIHAHFSRDDIYLAKDMLHFIETGDAALLQKKYMLIPDATDRTIPTLFAQNNTKAQEIYDSLKDLLVCLETVFLHKPSNIVNQYRHCTTQNEELKSLLDSFNYTLTHKAPVLQQLQVADAITRLIQKELPKSLSGADRLRLLSIEEDIEHHIYLGLGEAIHTWGSPETLSVNAKTKLIESLRLLIKIGYRHGLLSRSLYDFTDRLHTSCDYLIYSQLHDIANAVISDYKQHFFRILISFNPIAEHILPDQEDKEGRINRFTGGLMRRNTTYLHRATQLAEIIQNYTSTFLETHTDTYVFPKPRGPEPIPTELLDFSYVSRKHVNDIRALYGGKGSSLYHLRQLDVPVPSGVVLPSTIPHFKKKHGIDTYEKKVALLSMQALNKIQAAINDKHDPQARFGDPEHPIFLSVRSGSSFSMPGILTTIVNIGINDKTARAMLKKPEKYPAWFVYDIYRRFLRSFAIGVWDLDQALFSPIIEKYKILENVKAKEDLSPESMRRVVDGYKKIIQDAGYGKELKKVLRSPAYAVKQAIDSVYRSWDDPGAQKYRKHIGVSDSWGTAVVIQRMVFGNKMPTRDGDQSEISLTGVVITEDLEAALFGLHGEYKVYAQGDDLVGAETSSSSVSDISTLLDSHPQLYSKLESCAYKLADFTNRPQDIEFTVQHNKLYILQNRNNPYTLQQHDNLLTREKTPLITGLGNSGGAFRGIAAFASSNIEELSERAKELKLDGIILFAESLEPDQLTLVMSQKGAWIDSKGGRTSHAALIAQRYDIPAIVGTSGLEVNTNNRQAIVCDTQTRKYLSIINEGDVFSLDGETGEIFSGILPTTSKKDMATQLDTLILEAA